MSPLKTSAPHMFGGTVSRATSVGLVASAGAAIGAAWWLSDRAPYPYAQHRLLDLQLPFLSKAAVSAMLSPRRGERILEIGPGTGLHAMHVAALLGPDGTLDVLDIQQDMLDHIDRRAARDGIPNLATHRGDARELPFAASVFDAVYMVTALGEIPEPQRVLREAGRVLKPGGRIVVGEFFDRHWIPFGRLHRQADACGLHLTARRGPSTAYVARFRTCAAAD